MPHEAQVSSASVAWKAPSLLMKMGQQQYDVLQKKH